MLDKPSPTVTWTEERIARLTELHAQGFSASQIAAQIGGGITRNAVIGKAKRLKLPPAAKQPSVRKPPKPKDLPRANAVMHRLLTAEKPRVLPVPKDLPEPDQRIRLDDLPLPITECRYCTGDPLTADHSFCGEPVKEGSSWCELHHSIVFAARPSA